MTTPEVASKTTIGALMEESLVKKFQIMENTDVFDISEKMKKTLKTGTIVTIYRCNEKKYQCFGEKIQANINAHVELSVREIPLANGRENIAIAIQEIANLTTQDLAAVMAIIWRKDETFAQNRAIAERHGSDADPKLLQKHQEQQTIKANIAEIFYDKFKQPRTHRTLNIEISANPLQVRITAASGGCWTIEAHRDINGIKKAIQWSSYEDGQFDLQNEEISTTQSFLTEFDQPSADHLLRLFVEQMVQ